MLYNIYKQNTPSVSRNNMFEPDLRLVDTIFVESGCPIDIAKTKGHIHPLVECCNGYDLNGKPLKN